MTSRSSARRWTAAYDTVPKHKDSIDELQKSLAAQ
jgi:hypothetical protein